MEERNKKVERQTVYHEFGHVFGYYIATKLLKFNFGEIEEIALIEYLTLKEKKTSVKLSFILYEIPCNYHTDTSRKDAIEKLQRKIKENRKKFLCYIIYVLSGAVFNVRYHYEKPDYSAFEKIFDYNKKEEYGTITARAGDDFRKIDDRIFHLKWGHHNFKKIINMSCRLFDILDKNLVFYHLIADKFSLLKMFDENFNGRITKDKRIINDLLETIDKAIPSSNKERLKMDIGLLVDRYEAVITRCQSGVKS